MMLGASSGMRQKLREIQCLDESGAEALVIEWGFGDIGPDKNMCREFRLEDGSPVSWIGGCYEHFYTGTRLKPL